MNIEQLQEALAEIDRRRAASTAAIEGVLARQRSEADSESSVRIWSRRKTARSNSTDL